VQKERHRLRALEGAGGRLKNLREAAKLGRSPPDADVGALGQLIRGDPKAKVPNGNPASDAEIPLAKAVEDATKRVDTGAESAFEKMKERIVAWEKQFEEAEAKARKVLETFEQARAAIDPTFSGRLRARGVPVKQLFSPELREPWLQDALEHFYAGKYAQSAKRIARDLDRILNDPMAVLTDARGPTMDMGEFCLEHAMKKKEAMEQYLNQFIRDHPGTRVFDSPFNLRSGQRVEQRVFELGDGTSVRIKYTTPPGGMVDPWRKGPTYAVCVRGVMTEPTSGKLLPLPDDFRDEAFKINARGEPVPKMPSDIDPALLRGLPADVRRGFEDEVSDMGHVGVYDAIKKQLPVHP
jgi:hypothetical protein